jgi:hypothetical protein
MINSCMGFDAMVKTAIDGAGIIVSEPALK